MADQESHLPRVLIVDDSRIVRATLIKSIRGRYEVREESDGEAGWEALLIDPSIRVVISDLTMPRLDGYGLLERIRTAKVSRIREMPVIMISGDEDEPARQRAKDLGATDFITKGAGTAELAARLDTLLHLSKTQEVLQEARAQAVTDTASGLLSRGVLLRQVEQILSYAQRHSGQASVLMIGFDRLEELAASQGAATAEALLAQFAKLLAGVVRKEDSLARWSESRFAVVTPGIDAEQTRVFAERLRAAVARAPIHHHGAALQVTVTVGIANSLQDGIFESAAILGLAEQRMVQGQAAGGNRVAADGVPEPAAPPLGVEEALARIAAGQADIPRSRLAQLGLRLLPLLRLLDRTFQLGLPLADLESRLAAGTSEVKDGHNHLRSGVR